MRWSNPDNAVCDVSRTAASRCTDASMEQPMMTYFCRCRRVTDLHYCRSVDEYLCEECIEQLADEENEECDA